MACYPGQPGALQQPLAEHGAPGVAAAMDLHDDADPCDFELDDPGSLKPHSTQSTIKWLEGNYHYEEGICLPRSTIYEHYLDFCQREQLQPVNAASFGKIIRQQFPTLTTRRLGTRGQSKYHYYGLGIKPTSRYYTQEYIQKQQNPGTTRKEPEAKKPHAYYASKDKPSAVLPPFPDVSSLDLSDSVPKEKLHTFMVMYRAHCQRVLDSIVRATFDEVENFLLHFWQGMPNHLLPVLGSDTVIDLVAICDSTLYKAVSNVFISSPLQMIPENVAQEVQRFSTNLKPWLDSALKGLPDSLRTVKRSVADVFSQSLQRQKSLMHLADAARNALRSEEVLIQMSDDWAAIDVETIIAQTLYAIQPLDVPQQYMNMIPQFLDGFSRLLSEEKSSVEDFAVWVDNIIDKCFKKCKASKSVKDIGKIFLLTWKFFTSKIIREFTLTSAPSFGTFHLLHMLIDDYISHCLETLVEDEAHRTHFTNINLPTPESSVDEEKVLTLEAAEPTTAISEMALPSEPAPDFPLVAQAPASFTLPPSTNLTSAAQHGRISSDGGELNLHPPPPPPPSQEFPSSLDHGIAEGTSGVCSLRESVLPESGSLSAHLSSTAGLNSSQSTARGNLGSLGPLPPPPIGASLSLSSRSTSTNPLSSATNPLSSFVPNSTTLSSLTSIGGSISGGGSLLPSGLRLPDSTASSLSQHAHPPQLPPLPSHLSSLSFVNPFAQLQSSSLGMGVGASQQQQQHSRGQSQSQIGQNLSSITSAPSSQHLQQPPHNIQAPNVAAAPSGQQQGPSLQTLTTSAANLSSGGMPPMPLSHNMAAVAAAGGTTGGLPGSLSNPSALPLLPGMHNMYPYPYTGALPSAAAAVQSLPSQPITSAMVRMNAPAFPSQTLVPGYPSYVAPSLYGNAQPPVTNGNFTR